MNLNPLAKQNTSGPSAAVGSLITISGHFDPNATTAVIFVSPAKLKVGAPALSVTSTQVVTYVPFMTNKKGQTIYPKVSVTVEQQSGKHVTSHKAFSSFRIVPGSATGLTPGTVIDQMLADADAKLSTSISDIDLIQVLSATGTNTFPLYFDLQPLLDSVYAMQLQVERLQSYIQSVQGGATATLGQAGKNQVVMNSNFLAVTDEILLQLETGGLPIPVSTSAAIETARAKGGGDAAGPLAREENGSGGDCA